MQFQAQAAAQTSFPAGLIQNLLMNAAAAAAEAIGTGCEAVDERRGCGWFDSSYELSAGLEVIEVNSGLCFAD